MNLNKVIGLVAGAAFGLRAFDDKKSWPARLGYGLVAFDLVMGAVGEGGSGAEFSPANIGSSTPRLGYAKNPDAPPGKLNFQERNARTINERVAFVHEQMIQGTKDAKIYALARKALTEKNGDGSWKVPEKNAWAEACALFGEVKKRVRYTWDPTAYDAFQTPAKTLELRAGDCDDQVSLLGAMLRSVGYKVRSRIVQTKGSPDWNHIYLLAEIPGKGWRALDTTVNEPPGWEVPPEFVVKKQDYAVVEK